MTDEVVNGEESLVQPAASIEEEMLPKSRVNEVIQSRINKVKNSMNEEIESLKRENEELKARATTQPAVSADQIAEKAYAGLRERFANDVQEREEARRQEEIGKILHSFNEQVESGKKKFSDFDSVMNNFTPDAHPGIVLAVSQGDHGDEVLYELASNPQKLAHVSYLMEKDAKAGKAALEKVRKSIKENQDALAQERHVNEPLSRMRPSQAQGAEARGIEHARKTWRF